MQDAVLDRAPYVGVPKALAGLRLATAAFDEDAS